LAAKVASIAPDKDSRIFFVSGGSEAVETAMKMARKFHRNNGQPSRFKLIARNGSYHGSTFLDMSLGGGGVANPADFAPLMPYVYNISQPGEYNCHFCKDNSGCDLACARELERTILQEGSDTVAAFLGEPISVSSGVHIPHPDYWPTIREICDKYGVLLVCDEVITGFGRTGKWFATEHWGIKPDITTVAKALTSGYQPIGAAIASKAVADSFIGDPSATFKHLITFGGNPAACAAGLVNLEIMEREDLIGNSERMGTYLYERLQDFYEHPIVGEVRGGMGLLAAVQLVKDKDTRERFPAEAGLVQKATESMNKRGILTRIMGDSLHIAPPLSITKDEVDHLVESLEGVVTDLQDSLLGRIR
jgi:adenosylmethionine-8-amino-7-oxononanoate aminotransferase